MNRRAAPPSAWLRRPKVLVLDRNSIRVWLILAGLLLVRIVPAAFAVGTVLVVAAALLRIWAKGHLTQRVELTTTGPYALCRHPFYLGNLLLDLGVCFLVGRWELGAAYLVLWVLVYRHRLADEEAELVARYGDRYRAFQASTPRLLPWPRRGTPLRRADLAGFSWRNPNLAQREELSRFLRALSYPLLFLTWHEIREDPSTFLTDSHTFELAALCALAGLHLLDRFARRVLRHRRALLTPWLGATWQRSLFLLAFVALCFGVRKPELEADAVVFPVGLALGVLTLGIAAATPRRAWSLPAALGAELCVAALAALLGGVPYLFTLPLFVYAGLALEQRALGERAEATLRLAPRLERVRVILLVLVSTAAMVVKEGLIDGGIDWHGH